MVTPDRADDDISPYEYINPVGLNTSTSSLPTDSVVLSEPNGQKDIESEYITVNTSPSPRPDNTQHVCYIWAVDIHTVHNLRILERLLATLYLWAQRRESNDCDQPKKCICPTFCIFHASNTIGINVVRYFYFLSFIAWAEGLVGP